MYLDKNKIQDLIDKQRINLAEVEYLDLNLITKIINDFENQILETEAKRNIEQTRFRVIVSVSLFSVLCAISQMKICC